MGLKLKSFKLIRVIIKVRCVFLHSINNVVVHINEKFTVRILYAINKSCLLARKRGRKLSNRWVVDKVYNRVSVSVKIELSEMLLSS